MTDNHHFYPQAVLAILDDASGKYISSIDAFADVQIEGDTAVVKLSTNVANEQAQLWDHFRVTVERIEDDPGAMTAEERERYPALASLERPADTDPLAEGAKAAVPEATAKAVAEMLEQFLWGHIADIETQGDDWSGPHPISVEGDARAIAAAVVAAVTPIIAKAVAETAEAITALAVRNPISYAEAVQILRDAAKVYGDHHSTRSRPTAEETR